jgi:hypothetical protein
MAIFTPLLVLCNAYLNCMIAMPPEELRSHPTEVACMEYHKVAFPQFIGTKERLEEFKRIPWANFVCHESAEPVEDKDAKEFTKMAVEKYGMPESSKGFPIKAF